MPSPGPEAVRPGTPDDIAAAYAEIEPELATIPPMLIGRVTADVPSAVSIALGALPGFEGLVPALKEVFKKPPLAEIERLRVRALGLLYTHLRYVPRTKEELAVDLEQARVLRERLLKAADAHVSYGQLSSAAVAKIRDGSGHLDRANDLIALSALFRASWENIKERTLVTEADLDRASALGTQLVAELGGKVIGAASVAPGKSWAEQRKRAFRLFVLDYTEIRRAVIYLRYHEGDADVLAPTIHVGKKSAKARGGKDDGEETGSDETEPNDTGGTDTETTE